MTIRSGEARLARLLLAMWWIVFPLFAMLVGRFSFERGCRDPYELLQPVMQRQSGALLVAAVYVGAYVWVLAAGTLTLRMRDLSLFRHLRVVWGTHRWQVLAMVAAVAAEQVPRIVWQWIYHAAGAC